MAFMVSESLTCFNCNDFMINEVDVLKLNSTVYLKSLLEEPQGQEYYDDEQLESIIRSLEAEINPETKEEQVSVLEPRLLISNAELRDDQDLDFAWDNNINMDLLVPSSLTPSEDMNMYMDSHVDDYMDGVVDEVGGFNDYSSQFYYGFS